MPMLSNKQLRTSPLIGPVWLTGGRDLQEEPQNRG